nr:cytochrome c biogenesis protein [Gloiopeltis furcata]
MLHLSLNHLSMEIQLYKMQQVIYNLITLQLSKYPVFFALTTFTGGLLSSLNPCALSMLPITLSYLGSRNQTSSHINIFLIGLSSSIAGTIFITFAISKYYHNTVIQVPLLSSCLTILIGLNLLEIIQFNYFTKNIESIERFRDNRNLQDYITGFALGLNSSSCSTPILITISFLLSSSNNLLLDFLYLCPYLLGYILPTIILIQVTIKYNKLRLLGILWNQIIPYTGSIVIGLGIFSLLSEIFN